MSRMADRRKRIPHYWLSYAYFALASAALAGLISGLGFGAVGNNILRVIEVLNFAAVGILYLTDSRSRPD